RLRHADQHAPRREERAGRPRPSLRCRHGRVGRRAAPRRLGAGRRRPGGRRAVSPTAREHRTLVRYSLVSIAAAVATIALKASAAAITGSVGFLSDALESVVNLVAAVVALLALMVAARPPDDHHDFGHGKAEYLSAAVEGGMVFL